MEEIVTRKETLAVMTDVEETMTKKAEIGIALSVIIPISPSERSVTAVKRTDLEMEEGHSKENLNEVVITSKRDKIGLVLSAITLTSPSEINAIAVKQIDLEMEGGSLKENLNEVVIISKKDKIGLVLSAITLTSPSEINAIAVKQIDLVPVARPFREAEAMNAVVLDLKEEIPVVEEDGRQAVQVNHEDLDSEALVEAALGVIDQEEVAVDAEFGAPQHSFCLNPSNTYGEQGGYALGRCSRA